MSDRGGNGDRDHEHYDYMVKPNRQLFVQLMGSFAREDLEQLSLILNLARMLVFKALAVSRLEAVIPTSVAVVASHQAFRSVAVMAAEPVSIAVGVSHQVFHSVALTVAEFVFTAVMVSHQVFHREAVGAVELALVAVEAFHQVFHT